MEEIFDRLKILIGKEKLQSLHQKTVAIFGLGGVGSYVVEGLVRSGIGNFIIVDNDKVDITNINRQIIATTKTIGKYKVDVAEERIKEINPSAKVTKFAEFVSGESKLYSASNNEKDNSITLEKNFKEELNEKLFKTIIDADYIVDAIDTVSSKIRIIEFAKANNIPVISALGTGNKLDPTKLKIADIYDTKICPLAKVMRKELKKRDISNLDVVYSEEEPIKICDNEGESKSSKENIDGKNVKKIGSTAFVPSVAGLLICYKIVSEFIK